MQRALTAIVKQICAERGIGLTSFSDDWVLCLERDGRSTVVYGYDFALNSATAWQVSKDKTATSDVLAHCGVAHVEHALFHGPDVMPYITPRGNWAQMLAFFDRHGGDVVVKPNDGTGGVGVTRARTVADLEIAVITLFRTARSICLSPYVPIDDEIRACVFRGEVVCVYRKVRAPGEWRHNLGNGAVPQLLDASEHAHVVDLALRAARAIGVEVASVDVIEHGGTLAVLEINAGIMMEALARTPEGAAIAYRFYDRIVCASLGIALRF